MFEMTCIQPAWRNWLVKRAGQANHAGISAYEATNCCSCAAGSSCSYRKMIAFSTISPTVTNGVVRDGITSLIGIIESSIGRGSEGKVSVPGLGARPRGLTPEAQGTGSDPGAAVDYRDG